MKVKYFITIILIFSFVFFLISCCKPNNSSKLMDDFESYMSIEEARLMLPSHLRKWEVFIEQSDFQVILVKNYQSLDFVGQLRLVFTDGKNLSGTCFFTPEMRRYVEKLEKKNNFQLKKSKLLKNATFLETKILPNTDLYVRANFEGEICWHDKCFDEHYFFY